ncbi:MAG: PepSY domain-containing protein [Clostridia bacterium]|nr:PepSY domain-containing protein [Clostridia bacterium]
MNKILTVILCLTFVFALSACGEKNMGSNMQSGGIMSEARDDVSSFIEGVESGISSATSMLTQGNAKLTADEALDIALKDAGVGKNEIRELENNLDRENGILVYDIEFKSGNTEYSYDINAQTGEIIDREKDLND